MNEDYFALSYNTLLKVYRDKAYSNIATQNIHSHPQKNTILKIVNGVLENHYLLNYYISKLAPKNPQQAVRVLLMQSIYCIKLLKMNASAVINLALNTAKEKGKGEVAGFIGYCLNSAQEEIPLPKDKKQSEQIELNAPLWLISLLKKDYLKAYKRILSARSDGTFHLRLKNFADPNAVAAFENEHPTAERTLCGYFVKADESIREYLKKGLAFAQSLTSGYAVLAMGEVQGKRCLDMCAAPGGKSVYLAQRGGIVTSCDIYAHKIKLIEDYAKKAEVSLVAMLRDGAEYNKDFADAFDCVLVDAPCSGTGVISKRQDIIFNRKSEDIAQLTEIQKKLLENAARYLKREGTLVYSTCSVLKAENEEVIEAFLTENQDFVLKKIDNLPYNNQGMLQFLPDNKLDGFFICSMKKL
jgi:16S rRNA (cytosine967-C5)-methyltransferase